MSGKYTNGFSYFPSGASGSVITGILLAEGWFTTSGNLPVSLVTGRFNYGQRLSFFQNNSFTLNQYALKPLGVQNSVGGYIGVSLRLEADNVDWPTFGVYDAVTNEPLVTVAFTPNGIVEVWQGIPRSGVFLGGSEPGAFRLATDFDVEAFIGLISATLGSIQVRIDTGQVINLVNQNTLGGGSHTYFDSIFIGYSRGGQTSVLDFKLGDLRYYDTNGTINNTWLGTMRVQTLFTSGVGATTDFSVFGASSNWQAVQNKNLDDTIYVYTPTVGNYDLYEFQSLVNSPLVAWIQMTSFLRQDDATQLTAKNRISSGGTIADGAAFLTAQSYTGNSDIFELDPNTGLQFTGAGVNALQAGPYLYA